MGDELSMIILSIISFLYFALVYKDDTCITCGKNKWVNSFYKECQDCIMEYDNGPNVEDLYDE